MEIELFVGAASFRLGDDEAWALVHAIREKCVDTDHRPLDADSVRCLQLADMLAQDLDRGDAPAPVDVDLPQARVLTGYVLTPSVMETDQLRSLFDALVRFASDSY